MQAPSACGSVLTQGMFSQCSIIQANYSPAWAAGGAFSLFLLLDVCSCPFLEPALATVELLGEQISLTKMAGNYHSKRKVNFSC